MALSYAAKIRAKTTVLIHMTHELEYEWLAKRVPPSVVVGYDMMHLRF
jgi:phosphoribosyl 1,2-cyclic phosphate phosphodiesterase